MPRLPALVVVVLALALALVTLGACAVDGAAPPAGEPIAPRGAVPARAALPADGAPALDPAAAAFPVPGEVPDAHACVDDGCPAGLRCDWVQGCREQVDFCCIDEMCGDGRRCDLEAGGVCVPAS
ncbi:MAG: hypothetical protein HS111_26155 [Kofleriaceae bacterium]|nr:hypothetical protein [Kofleriaceae bacterium]MCL4227599.1 hypothetical protein [Myxococcales bacterium]